MKTVGLQKLGTVTVVEDGERFLENQLWVGTSQPLIPLPGQRWHERAPSPFGIAVSNPRSPFRHRSFRWLSYHGHIQQAGKWKPASGAPVPEIPSPIFLAHVCTLFTFTFEQKSPQICWKHHVR